MAPFGGCCEGENVEEIRYNILNANYSFEPKEYWCHVSNSAKEFIAHILVADPTLRPTADECQEHPWLGEWKDRDDVGLSLNVQQALKKFRGMSDIRKLMCEVIGFTLLPEQIVELTDEFEKLDVEQNGEISLENLKKVLIANAGSGSYNFTEEEVEDIFNSMRLHKTNTTIHWHHFLAAGLSECAVDDRNHRLAFDRLDKEQKGYITFEDIVGLTGATTLNRRVPSLKKQWGNSHDLCRKGSKIAYEDFVKICSPVSENDSTSTEYL